MFLWLPSVILVCPTYPLHQIHVYAILRNRIDIQLSMLNQLNWHMDKQTHYKSNVSVRIDPCGQQLPISQILQTAGVNGIENTLMVHWYIQVYTLFLAGLTNLPTFNREIMPSLKLTPFLVLAITIKGTIQGH